MQKSDFDNKLNNALAGSANLVHFCFMNKIYTRTDKPDVYELAMTDLHFSFVILYRTEDLRSILNYGYFYDFSLDGDYVMCNPQMQVSSGDSLYENEIENFLVVDFKDSIFSFLARGSEQNYVFLNDDVVADTQDWNGYGVTYFHNVRFSKSTMSIYVMLSAKDGVFNKMLVVEENNRLTFKPFYYGVPSGKTSIGGDFVFSKNINNVKYDVYKVEFLPVITDAEKVLSAPIINTAVQYQTCYEFAIRAVESVLKEYYSVADSVTEWVGGSKQYTSSYKISFKSAMEKLTKRDRDYIVSDLLKGYEPAFSADPRISYLKTVFNFIEFAEDGTPELNSLSSVLASIKLSNLYCSAYLMAIKYCLFCSHRKLVDGTLGCLSGGRFEDDTIVEEGF